MYQSGNLNRIVHNFRPKSWSNSQSVFETLVKNLNAGLAIIDERGEVIFANQVATEILACTAGDILQRIFKKRAKDSENIAPTI